MVVVVVVLLLVVVVVPLVVVVGLLLDGDGVVFKDLTWPKSVPYA